MTHGLSEALLRLIGSVGRHLASLTALARMEAGEAAHQTLRIIVYLLIGGVALLLSYVFLLLAVAFFLAGIFHISWQWLALGFALFHAIIVAVCSYNVRELLSRPWFPSTGTEIRRNFEMLGDASPGSPQEPASSPVRPTSGATS